jgi:TPR repeat protein
VGGSVLRLPAVRFTEITTVGILRLGFHGSPVAMRFLAVAFSLTFFNPLISAEDRKISDLEAKAERGFVQSQIELARAYYAGYGVMQDLKKAAYWYQKAAENGDPVAQNEIGFLYQKGAGVPADSARAMHWYQLSAASGLLRAKVNVGVMYLWGSGVRKDPALAAQFFRDAANRGNGAAATYLGTMYYFGIGLDRDRATAEHWFATGAKLRDPVAARDLGSLYLGMDGHFRNVGKAATLLRKSANGGYISAMEILGALLINHPELAKSPQEARLLLESASNVGSWRSSAVLGILARDGNGKVANPEAAYYDFQLAVLQGGDPAQRLLTNDLNALSEKLTDERRTAITSSANTWFQQHHLATAFLNKHVGSSNDLSEPDEIFVSDAVHSLLGALQPAP